MVKGWKRGTALHTARGERQAKLLLDKIPKGQHELFIFTLNADGKSALHTACENAYVCAAGFLLKHGKENRKCINLML